MSDDLITREDAYMAMFFFINNEYQLSKKDELAGLMSGLSWNTWGDRKPANPGAWEDWLEAIEKAKASQTKVNGQ